MVRLDAQHPPRARLTWAVAVVVALGLHLGWVLAFRPAEIPRRATEVELPRMAYRPVLVQTANRMIGDDLQAVWSPILFSLPTRLGFSQSQLTPSGLMLPPAELPPIPLQRLNPLAEDEPPGRPSPALTTDDQIARSLAKIKLPPPVSPPPTAQSAAPGYNLLWPGELNAAHFLSTPFDLPAQTGSAPRQAVFYLSISEEGLVLQALVDVSSGDTAWDARAARLLRSWQARPSARVRSGRVQITQARAPSGATQRGEGS